MLKPVPISNAVSLTVPMDNDWSQIYLYVAGETYKRLKEGNIRTIFE